MFLVVVAVLDQFVVSVDPFANQRLVGAVCSYGYWR
jgi:hypothetical protein